MMVFENSGDLAKVVITDLLLRDRLLQLWEEFREKRPDDFARMLRYDGSDPAMVEAMRIWVKVFVLGKLERGELPVRNRERRAREAGMIGSSVVQLAKALHPEIVFRRVDDF